MVLCEVQATGNFALTWLALTVSGFLFIMLSSGVAFKYLYWAPTFKTWRSKVNPKYPSPEKVREEIIMMAKGMLSATLCPTLSLSLSQWGYSQAYCGVQPYGWAYLVLSTLGVAAASDLFEWFYHYLGHTTVFGWQNHKPHHQFSNPTPFAVISDDYFDQFVRASPLLVFPLLVPVNMDAMFTTYLVFFYLYGIVLHSGHEMDYPDAHHPIVNTSYHHYLHHAKSTMNKPYHTGFFIKLWDNLAGSTWPNACLCVKCQIAAGKRTEEEWKQTRATLPDYSVLLSPSFWLKEGKKAA